MTEPAPLLLTQGEPAFAALQQQLSSVLQCIRQRQQQQQPIAAKNTATLHTQLATTQALPQQGSDFNRLLQDRLMPLLPHMVDVNHPHCLAHLHCPSLLSAISAELLIAASNLSMDSWDQSGVATLLEQQVIGWLQQLLDYPENADGTLTSGGTQSNFMGLLLAREAFAQHHALPAFNQHGITTTQPKLAILTTPNAHFSITQAARWLGIGSDYVFAVPPAKMPAMLTTLKSQSITPIACVATAGCTDFGNIDPLIALREFCDEHQLWLHVDAAVGGALLVTTERERLAGIASADSVTLDFHKLFLLPISASALMVKNPASFTLIEFHSDYLHRAADAAAGIVNLAAKSLQTTRRCDALKIWITWQQLGLSGLQILISTLLQRTREAATLINYRTALTLLAPPSINTVVFRYQQTQLDPAQLNSVNQSIRRELFNQGLAIIGETTHQQHICLKLTLMNPQTSKEEIATVLDLISDYGQQFSQQLMAVNCDD